MSPELKLNPSLEKIIEPYLNSDSSEVFYYNSTLEKKISQLAELLPSLSESEINQAEGWIQRLKHQIQTNLHYVQKQRTQDAKFSVIFCALTNNAPGLRYLLRVGEDSNQMENGKAAIHIAASRSFAEITKTLCSCPALDIHAKTLRGKKAIDLVSDQGIESLIRKKMCIKRVSTKY